MIVGKRVFYLVIIACLLLVFIQISTKIWGKTESFGPSGYNKTNDYGPNLLCWKKPIYDIISRTVQANWTSHPRNQCKPTAAESFVILDYGTYTSFQNNVFHFLADFIVPFWIFFDNPDTIAAMDAGAKFSLYIYLDFGPDSFQRFMLDMLKNYLPSVSIFYFADVDELVATNVYNRSTISYESHILLYDVVQEHSALLPVLSKWRSRVWNYSSIVPRSLDINSPKITLIQRNGVRNLKLDPSINQPFVDYALLTPAEQVRQTYNSDILIGIHGAALVHSLWLRPGSVLVQIVPDIVCDFYATGLYEQIPSLVDVFPILYCVPSYYVNYSGVEAPTIGKWSKELNGTLQYVIHRTNSITITLEMWNHILLMANRILRVSTRNCKANL